MGNSPNGIKGKVPTLVRSRGKAEQAQTDTAGILIAKLLQTRTGDHAPLHESLEAICQSPERILGVTLTLANILTRMCDAYYPGGLQNLVDWCIKEWDL